jgi:hypothetical protein
MSIKNLLYHVCHIYMVLSMSLILRHPTGANDSIWAVQLRNEWAAWGPARMFTLELIIGGAMGIGTILALFAWSGAGL